MKVLNARLNGATTTYNLNAHTLGNVRGPPWQSRVTRAQRAKRAWRWQS